MMLRAPFYRLRNWGPGKMLAWGHAGSEDCWALPGSETPAFLMTLFTSSGRTLKLFTSASFPLSGCTTGFFICEDRTCKTPRNRAPVLGLVVVWAGWCWGTQALAPLWLQSDPRLGSVSLSPPGRDGLAQQVDCMAHFALTSKATFLSMPCLLSTKYFLKGYIFGRGGPAFPKHT